MPDDLWMEKPSVGDELLMVRSRTRYVDGRRTAEPEVSRVTVTKVAKYRFSIRREDGWGQEFDVRTGQAWGSERSTRARLYTEEGWKAHLREQEADQYLRESGVLPFHFRGSFLKATDGRLLELANLLREFEGLEPIT